MKKYLLIIGTFAVIIFSLLAFIVYEFKKDGTTTTRDLAFKEWKLLPTQKIVTAEITGTASIHYEHQKWSSFASLGKFSKYAPGARSVNAEGRMDLVIGYDSTTALLSPDATAEPIVRNDTLFFLVRTRFPEPIVLYSSVKTLPEVHTSLISGEIPDQEFFGFVDSAAKADGAQIIANQRPQLMASYAAMTASLLEQFFHKEHPGKNIVIRVKVDGGESMLPSLDPARINTNISISKKILD